MLSSFVFALACAASLAMTEPPPADIGLAGIARASSGRFAVTLTSGGRSRAVLVGDPAFGCVVASATERSVVLDCAGEKRELRLAGAAPATIAAPTVAKGPAGDAAAPADFDIRRTELEERLGREMSRLMTETTLVPVTERGRVSGFTLTRIPPGTILEELGIRAGDVLTSVNDTPIDGFTTLVGLWPRLQREGFVRAQILRDGRPMDLSVRIR